jgi:hypothetical protein
VAIPPSILDKNKAAALAFSIDGTTKNSARATSQQRQVEILPEDNDNLKF